MRWLVAGASGMLAQDLVPLLRRGGHEVVALGRDDLDITDPAAVDRAVGALGVVDVVVNCAAFTAVDAAESEEASAFAVNAMGAAVLARAARMAGARMVHVSTDYVFDGRATTPYSEGSPLAPRSAYGRTKAAGEWAVRAEAPDHLVVRTAWLYGAHGACFPRTIARLAVERGSLDVVDDEVGQPTWTVDLAHLIERLVTTGAAPGTYHGTSSGRTSWFGFARAVVEAAGLDPQIISPTTSAAFARPAPRPAFSVLGHDACAELAIGDWEDRWKQAAPQVLG
ncbi:MAG: dTDP-4-dehydrorhamnose reductase [Cellulomonadaceae bacterium]|nr:dTDP-4-dehydrorhamnose reductase [Cellulomonadaceae bacterium]